MRNTCLLFNIARARAIFHLHTHTTCKTCHMRRRIHACYMRRRIHACHMRRRIHACHMRRRIHACHTTHIRIHRCCPGGRRYMRDTCLLFKMAWSLWCPMARCVEVCVWGGRGVCVCMCWKGGCEWEKPLETIFFYTYIIHTCPPLPSLVLILVFLHHTRKHRVTARGALKNTTRADTLKNVGKSTASSFCRCQNNNNKQILCAILWRTSGKQNYARSSRIVFYKHTHAHTHAHTHTNTRVHTPYLYRPIYI